MLLTTYLCTCVPLHSLFFVDFEPYQGMKDLQNHLFQPMYICSGLYNYTYAILKLKTMHIDISYYVAK